MRPTLTRLAESVTARPLNLKAASASLYPPIPYGLQVRLFFRDTSYQQLAQQVIPEGLAGPSISTE
jgi:hypothetical protein